MGFQSKAAAFAAEKIHPQLWQYGIGDVIWCLVAQSVCERDPLGIMAAAKSDFLLKAFVEGFVEGTSSIEERLQHIYANLLHYPALYQAAKGSSESALRIKKAAILAFVAFDRERSDHNPGVNKVSHSLWIANEAQKLFGKEDPDASIVGLLHDLPEDRSIRLETIRRLFGKEVADDVAELTLPPESEWQQLFGAQVDSSLSGRELRTALKQQAKLDQNNRLTRPRTLAVKALDNTHNVLFLVRETKIGDAVEFQINKKKAEIRQQHQRSYLSKLESMGSEVYQKHIPALREIFDAALGSILPVANDNLRRRAIAASISLILGSARPK